MKSIVICEKPSQKAKIETAVGEKYGKVYAARGHLLRLADPHEVNPAWKNWSTQLLYPENGEFPRVPSHDKDHQERLSRIKQALTYADTVFLATDADREGQLIGEEILEFCKFRGTVYRISFNAEDPVTLTAAFNAPKPNIEFQSLYHSAFARQQADQVFNLSITRALTVLNQNGGGYGVVGAGRVKTPTMAIVCARELEIRNFKPQSYYELQAGFATDHGEASLVFSPNSNERILDETVMRNLQVAVLGWNGPLNVTTSRKNKTPPPFFSMASMQKAASRKFKWAAQKTLDVAQKLYDADLITYPRASGKWLPEVEIERMPQMLACLKTLDQAAHLQSLQAQLQPVIRKGKNGHFSDAALKAGNHSHHAIVPNLNTADRWKAEQGSLGADERNLFDLVVNQTLQALMPDYVYDSKKIEASVDVPGRNAPLIFKRTGASVVSQGWREITAKTNSPATAPQAGETADEDGEEEENVSLPNIPDKATAEVIRSDILDKMTSPPKRYNEGDLVDDMMNAWRFVKNPEKQERLKETNGIGTDATRGQIIEGLKDQGYLDEKKGQLHATDEALRMFLFLRNVSPHVLSPGLTAEWEEMFEEIVRKRRQAGQIIEAIAGTAGKLIEIFSEKIQSVDPLKLGAPPVADEQILQRAKALSARTGIALPKGSETSNRLLIDFLKTNDDREKNDMGGFVPSAKAIEYAEKLAGWLSTELPDLARRDATHLNKWINEHKQAAEAVAPTPTPSRKQVELMHKVSNSTGTPIPPEALKDMNTASAWLDKHMKKPTGRSGKKSSSASKRRTRPSNFKAVFS